MTRRLKPRLYRSPPPQTKKMDANNVMSGFRRIKLLIANSAHPER